ncbi:major facilitator superfamily domain-containing protein [Lasiosphaeria ovina]|uniref:Major facilitator superfamily domain-containing protein n=1 Tax=Lasiosphaeria ovina TaxID=92902 RepID=A0AAE0JWB0_9PEZI|nr:major facilitator superfamily domain-containing protein [Lasiosphaeria ovina]
MFSCLDTSIVSTALFTISVDFDNYQDAPWTILGYLLTYMSFAVGLSKLSDIYGRRNLLAVSWVLFSGFSIWCALAGNMNQLIAARALQGIGGSGLYSLAQVCLIEQGPNRPEVVGALVGITLSISYILGPLLGGAISNWTWRGVFWINVPFGTVALIGIYTLWPEERRKKYDAWTAISKIDFIGNMLLVVASILLVFSIQEGGSFVWSWSSPVIIWSLVVSGVCWVLLALWESYLFYGKCQVIQPIFPLRLAMGRVYLSGLIVTLLTGFVYISLVIKIPERLQVIYGDTALQAGIHLLPLLGPCAFGSFLGGVLSKKQNLTSQTLIAGCALQALGIGLVYGLAQPESRLHLLLGFTAIYGLGVGLCFSACTIIAAIEARFADFAAAQGAVAQARVFGGALGLAACTIIFNENLRRALGSSSPSGGGLTDEQQLSQIQHGPVVLAPQASGVTDSVIRRVHLAAFKEEMLVMTVFAGVAVVVSLATYKSKPALVAQTIAQHKESASRASDTELETTSSVRSLIR